MSVAGLCQICELARADHQCDRCGSFVCLDHYDADAGVCIECSPGREADYFAT